MWLRKGFRGVLYFQIAGTPVPDSGLQSRDIIRDREGHYVIVTKGSISQEDTAVLTVYAPNKIATKYMKQK